MIIENWGITSAGPYSPPEDGRFVVGTMGEDSTKKGIPPGQLFRTSAIAKVEGNIITTRTGSRYKLGKPKADYVKFCEENGLYVPTDEIPIRIL